MKGANSLSDPAQRTRIRGEGADALEVGRLQDVALVEGDDLVSAAAGVVGAGADGYLVLGQFRGFSFGWRHGSLHRESAFRRGWR